MESTRVERNEGLVTITLDRPEKKNALDGEMWLALEKIFAELTLDPEARAVILTGAGGNFSAGANLGGGKPGQGLTGRPVQPIVTEMRVMGDIVLSLARMPKPTLAVVDGVCVGVALGLALACDLLLASDRARFSEIFAKRGLACDGGTSWLLPRRIGLQKAKELAFFADIIDADAARELGIVNRVVPAGELTAVAQEWGRRLAAQPSMQISIVKRQLNQSYSMTMAEALEWEGVAQTAFGTSEDAREAMLAFLEKREPRYTGR